LARVRFPYGDGMIGLELADRYAGEIASPRSVAGLSDSERLILNALENPIESPPLDRLAGPGKKAAVVIDDVSRETPVHLILRYLIDRLRLGGVASEDIRIVIALGTHRPMTVMEINDKVGSEIAGTYPIINTSCLDEDEMVFMGISTSGIPAWVNRAVAAADIRIGVGSITPHMDTGYSGGAKIILPGVCSARTLEAFHARQAEISGNQLGVEDAPLRRDLEVFVQERVGLDFIFNVVMDGRGGLYQCVAGHFLRAHRRGVQYAREVYGVPVSRRYPVVVSNSYPAQIDLWQSVKGIASGEMMTSDRGTLILLTHCREGNRTHPTFAEYIGSKPDQLLRLLKTGKAEDPVACALAVPVSRIKQRIKIALVSHGLSEEIGSEMGFTYYDSLERAVEKELSALADPRGSLGILTHGGVSLPLLE
jgi:nickel-dependent lactate racemase